MQRKTINSFDNVSSTGIDNVPQNGVILVEDSDGAGSPSLLVITDKTGITDTTTIADLLLLPNQYSGFGSGITQTTADFISTAGQTEFVVGYNVNSVALFAAGIKLDPDVYTATSGTSVILDTGTDLGTWVQVVSSSDAPASGIQWSTIENTPTTTSGYGITDALIDTDIGVEVEAHDITILKEADLGITVQEYDVLTVKSDNPETFTAPIRTSITSEDNNIDFTQNNNFTLTAAATSMGGTVLTGCTGQQGVITILSAENITGWDASYNFKTIPVDLSGTERFGYFIESESSIAIGRVT